MTVSLRRMSAGTGYRYLLRSVAVGDGDRALSTPLTRYYAEAGTPPGRWMGSGVHAFSAGQLKAGMPVTEEQLALLIGMGRDPVTGDQLGRAYAEYKSLNARIKERVDGLDTDLSAGDRAAESSRIQAEESRSGIRHAVAGYDLTFSVPKSVSVLWGLADGATQERIVAAHHAAVADVLDFFEREVAATRAGVAAGDGAVAQVEIAGVAAVAYDHYDSRAGDPQLHTHVVVANKVKAVLDGRWRSLDGRPVYASLTALSALYNGLLADRLTSDLGVVWELRERAADRNPQWEITGISDELIKEFSSRSREIDLEKDRLISAYLARHGRRPSATKIIELRAQATLATRPPKEIRSLADLTAQWRHRAGQKLGVDPTGWARSVLARSGTASLTVDDVALAGIHATAASVLAQVSTKRATWTHWNLMAEVSRQIMGVRFASPADREAIVGMIVDAAESESVRLTPPELAFSPAAFRRPDGTSVFRQRRAAKYSSAAVLDAEAHLLSRSDDSTGPRVSARTIRRVVDRGTGDIRVRLSREQAAALESIAASGRQVDLLVGPAGAGKTTTMRALRAAWTAEHGPASVVGLAPSAAAAQALQHDLGIACDNTAKWLHEYNRGNTAFRPGQLVILDEATLASTAALDRITTVAADAGAKVLLVGDPYQLQSVDAGGAFALLIDRRPDAPALTEIHRFTHAWEKEASLALRTGDLEVISTYARHDRIREGDTDQMLDTAYRAWRADQQAGKASILVTESAHAVRALNERARAEHLLTDGAADGREVTLAEDVRASVGDLVITRRNDRTLRTTHGGWVKNGDRWRVTDIRGDGSVGVRRLDPSRRGSAVLDPGYVQEHLDLGYAVTAHRAQGVTVDTAHVVVTAATTRQNLYVSMSRGRDANIAYVALDQPDDSHTTPEHADVTARTVLYGVLRHAGDDRSAHQTIQTEFEVHASIAQQAAELESIAATAQHDRFADLFRRSGLTPKQHQELISSPAFGPLTAALRRAEAYHHDLERLTQHVVAQHSLEDAGDIAAVLRYRIDKAASPPPRPARGRKPRLIAGLIPEPLGPMADEDRQAIDQRKRLIEERACALAEQAIETSAPWLRRLDPFGVAGRDRERWIAALATVAAYRDRYEITSNLPLGGGPTTEAQRADRQHALHATREAAAIAAASRRVGSAAATQVPTVPSL
ncbi:MobF family relaxase [Nocardioides panacihumi]|uniref:MobF family relaxase n=1 Tax=Nocardioides panacihumi TaxID=400774 RepID=UPI0031E3840C